MIRAYLSPITTMVGAIATMLTLVVAVRQGQFGAVAAYSAGVSVGAIASVIAAGGSTIAFITGNWQTQSAVRSVRLRFVLPLVSVSVFAFGVPYSLLSDLSLSGVLLGGAVVACNSMSELESGYLKRKLNTPSLFWSEVSTRFSGLVLVFTGSNFAFAMLMVAVLRFLILSILARKDPSRISNYDESFRLKLARTFNPSLMATSLMYVLIDRTLFLLVPLMTTGAVAGYFAAIMSSQQAVAGAISSGLQTSMAARSEQRVNITDSDVTLASSWFRKFEKSLVAAATAAAIFGIVLYQPFLDLLGIPVQHETLTIWIVVVASLPLAVAARSIQYVLLSEEKNSEAFISTLFGAISLVTVSLFALLSSQGLLVILALPLAEIAAYSRALAVHKFRT